MANSNSVQVRVGGQQQLRSLYRDLRREADGKERIKQLRKDLRDAAKPLVPLVKAKILALPSEEQNAARGDTPLRKRMARAVTIQTRFVGKRAGVYVYMNPRKMPEKWRALPAYFERADKKAKYRHLRHRVYPTQRNPDTWVGQDVPRSGYFTLTVKRAEPRVARAVEQVVKDTARRLESGR